MNWLAWVWIVIGLASLYWFAQILYYLAQGAARLKKAAAVTAVGIASLSDLPVVLVPRLEATKENERAAIIAARRRRSRQRANAGADRQRRLVARIEKLMSEGGKST